MPRGVPSLRGQASREDDSGEWRRNQAHMPVVSQLESQFPSNLDCANFPLGNLASEEVSSGIEGHSRPIVTPSDALLENRPTGPRNSRGFLGDQSEEL
eukprot:11498514-Alexandrium_andersonii.AAC.1